MTKIYLVSRERFCNEKLVDSYIVSVFTNKRKALSLKRYYDAMDKEYEIQNPILSREYKSKTHINTRTINQKDYNEKALEIEARLTKI